MSLCLKVQNHQVNGQANYKRAAPIFHDEDHRTHMLVVALDYGRTGRPLTCTTDAKNIEELARQCGVHELVTLLDEQCTREAMLGAIKQMGSKCGPDDYFLFYFAGHGAHLLDTGCAEADEPGEAFVCVNRKGKVSPQSLISGDEFGMEVISALPTETRILLLTDCCHTGTIVDLSKDVWRGRQAIAIAGCQDPQCVDDTSRGGIFTHSMLLAIDKLSKVGRDNYSVGMLFNATLLEDELVFGGKQDVAVQAAPGFSPDAMAWPLIPPVGYQATLSRCTGPEGRLSKAAAPSVSPALLQHVTYEALNVPVPIEEYIGYVQGGAVLRMKPCRACTAGCSTGPCSLQ